MSMAGGGTALPPAGVPADPARRRLLAAGLLLALAAGTGFGVVVPLLDGMSEAVEQEERQRALLARLERISAQGPALRRELEAMDAALAAPELLIRAPSASQAAAQLQAALRGLLDAEGIALDSAQALPPVPQGPLLRVGLRVELRAGLEPLTRLLHAMESHRPPLLVREAMIALPGQAGAGIVAGSTERLAIRLDVLALARLPESSTDARRS